jgi:phage-related minor tail protein
MSESTEVAGLKIAVDATSATAGAAALDKFTASAVRADSANKSLATSHATVAAQTAQMASAYADAGRAAQAATTNLSPLTARLKEQVDLFGKSPVEVAKYRAAQAGLSQEESTLAVSLAKKLTALQAGESAAKAAAKAEDVLAKGIHASGTAVQFSSLQIRESLSILRDIGSGRYSRIPGSFSILAQQGNLAAVAMKALSSPLVVAGIAATATAATVGVLAYQAEKAAESVKLIGTALAATGKSALVSDDQIRQTIDLIQQLHGVNRAEATASVDSLARAPFANVEQFKEAASILGDLAAALGVKVPDAAKVLSGALESPIQGLRRLQQAHIALTPDQQLLIERLHDEGKESQAAAALIDALQEKTKGLAQQNLTPLQTSIQNLGNAWHGASTQFSESAVITGVLATLTGSFNAMAKAINAVRDGSKGLDDTFAAIFANPAIAAVLPGPLQALASKPQTGGPGRVATSTGLAAAKAAADAAEKVATDKTAAAFAQDFDRVDQLTRGLKSQAAATQELIIKRKELQAALDTKGEITEPAQRAVFQDRIKAINEQLTKKDDHGFEAKKLELLQSLNKAQEELTATTNGTTLAEDRGVKATQTWLDNNQKALKISEATKAVLLSIAAAADKTNEANKVALETIAIKQRTEGVQSQIDRLTGNTSDSQAEAIHKQLDEPLRKDQASATEVPALQAEVDAEKSKVAELLKVAAAADDVLQIEKAISVAEKANATVVKTAQVEESAGYISHAQAVQKVVQANLAEADSLSKELPALQAQLAAMKATDPAAQALTERIGELNLKILELRTHTSELTAAMKGAFESSVSSALDGVIEKTETANQAVKNIEKSLEHAFVSTFTKGLVNDVSTLIFSPSRGGGTAGDRPSGLAGALPSVAGLFGIKPPAAGVAGATGAAGAAASAAPISAAFTAGSSTVSTALSASFASGAATLASAITESLSGANPTNVGGSDLGPLFGLGGGTPAVSPDMSASPLVPLATGGYTGDGGKYEPAGIVHAGEFVHRAEVVRQPGALSFLSDFNDRGMQAVAGYAGGGFVRAQSYADGGAVKPSAFSSLTHADAPAATISPTSVNQVGATINTALNTGGNQAGGTLTTAMAQGGQIAGQTITQFIASLGNAATQPGTGLAAGGSNTYSKTNNDKFWFGLAYAGVKLGISLFKPSAPAPDIPSGTPPLVPLAIGGYTGDGGKYEPAGIVHAGEFVHRAEVVRQPGAMQFLSAFNDKGMSAVSSWGARGYAYGGLVSAPPLARIGESMDWRPAAGANAYAVPRTFAAPGYADGGIVYPAAPASNTPSVSLPRAAQGSSSPTTPRYAGQGAPTGVNLVLSPEMAHTTVADLIDKHLNDSFAKR